MIDIHSHILPGLDDGAQDIYDTLEMVQLAARSGITAMVATPHCNIPGRYENYFDDRYVKTIEQVRAAVHAEHLPVQILHQSDLTGIGGIAAAAIVVTGVIMETAEGIQAGKFHILGLRYIRRNANGIPHGQANTSRKNNRKGKAAQQNLLVKDLDSPLQQHPAGIPADQNTCQQKPIVCSHAEKQA